MQRRTMLASCALALLMSASCGRAYGESGEEVSRIAQDDAASLDAEVDGSRQDASAPVDATGDVHLPSNAVVWPENNHAYAIVVDPIPLAWESARDRAIAVGGHLASITSASELDFVKVLLLATTGAFHDTYGPWIGAFQPTPNGPTEPDGGWIWTTGEAFTFSSWTASEPNNDLGREHWAHYITDATHWNDIGMDGASSVFSFVVEWE